MNRFYLTGAGSFLWAPSQGSSLIGGQGTDKERYPPVKEAEP